MTNSLTSTVLLSYLIYLSALVLFIFIGKLFIKSQMKRLLYFNNSFFYSFLGIVLFMIGFSLIYTSVTGTVNLVMLLLLIFWLFQIRKKQDQDGSFVKPPAEVQGVGILFLLANVVFVLNLILRLSIDKWPFFKATKDEIFYALVTKFMSVKHVESSSIDWFAYEGRVNLRPYHYIEQWLNLFPSKFFSMSSLETMYFVVMPVFFFITVLGLYTLFSAESKLSSGFKVFIALLLCFLGFPAIDPINGMGISSAIPGNLKYLPLFWISFLLIHLLRNNRWNNCFALIALFPLFNYGLLPITLVCLLIYTVLFKYLFKEKREWYVFASYAFCLIGIPLLTKINSFPGFHGQYDQKISEIFSYYRGDLLVLKLKLIFGMGFFYFKNIFINNCLIIAAVVVLCLYFKGKRLPDGYQIKKPVFILFALVLFSSLAICAILNFILDAYQIFYLTFQLMSGLMLILLLIRLTEYLKPLFRWILTGVFCCLFILNICFKSREEKFEIFNRYDESYRTEMKNEFLKRYDGKAWTGLRFMNRDYYKSIYQIQSTDQYEGFPFVFLTDNTHLYTANIEAVEGNEQDKLGIYKFAYDRYTNIEYFNRWIKFNGYEPSNPSSLRKAQLKFMDAFNVDFLVLQNGVELPFEIVSLVDKEIICRTNGERICFIKKEDALNRIPKK